MTPAERFAMSESVPAKSFFTCEGLHVTYYAKQDEILVSNWEGAIARMNHTDVALLRRLLEIMPEMAVPVGDERYQKSLKEMST